MKRHWMLLNSCGIALVLATYANTASAWSLYGQSSQRSFPEISLTYEQVSPSLKKSCDELNSSGAGFCRTKGIKVDSFQKRLSRARLFSKVQRNQKDIDYTVTFASALVETDGSVTGVAAQKNIVYEIDVLWRGVKLSQNEYRMPYVSQSMEANKLKVTTATDHSKTLTDRFLKDTRKNGVFTTEYLLEKLQATNYKQELQLPKGDLGFVMKSSRQYHDPLQGTRLRYSHNNHKAAAMDVHVYPIAQADWSDIDAALQQEAISTRMPLQQAEQNRFISNLKFTDGELSNWSLKGQRIRGLTETSQFTDVKKAAYQNYLYLFIVEDKFIKVKATIAKGVNAPTPLKFVQALLNEIAVPKESRYMAELRLQNPANKTAVSSTDD